MYIMEEESERNKIIRNICIASKKIVLIIIILMNICVCFYIILYARMFAYLKFPNAHAIRQLTIYSVYIYIYMCFFSLYLYFKLH
jgi:hypothetical protein